VLVAAFRQPASVHASISSSNVALLGMTGVVHERTLLPPEDPADLMRFARELAGLSGPEDLERARLVGPQGEEIDIPAELCEVLRDVVDALLQGVAISIAPHNTMLTTQEAADLLNISRPTLVRLLTEGEIPYMMRGCHRRVLLRDVLDHQERTRVERQRVLDEMVAEGEADGLYDVTAVPRSTR
jgi:excisionase family DNA binding protein